MKKYCLTILLLTFFLNVSAQEDDPFDYGREFIFGVSKSTNSGFISGGFLRYGFKKNERLLQTFGIEVANVRHPQEIRRQIGPFLGTATIYQGKEKYLLSTRLVYGYDYILFKKADQKGVQINVVGVGGPSIGLISPYYLRTSEGGNVLYSQLGGAGVVGPAGYFAGLGDMEAAVGLHARLSILFEFGSFKDNITGFEIGAYAELYNRTIEIMPTATRNYNFYPAAFISLLFGSRK